MFKFEADKRRRKFWELLLKVHEEKLIGLYNFGELNRYQCQRVEIFS